MYGVLVYCVCDIMVYDLVTFTLCPSLEDFDRCRKICLNLLIFFNRSVCHTASKKKVVKVALYDTLVAQKREQEAYPTAPHSGQSGGHDGAGLR